MLKTKHRLSCLKSSKDSIFIGSKTGIILKLDDKFAFNFDEINTKDI